MLALCERQNMSSSDSTILLNIENISKYYPLHTGLIRKSKTYIRAIDDVSFNLKTGETFGLVGESGCGKSTLGRLIAGLEQPTTGNISFEGENIFAAKRSGKKLDLARKIQIIFQDPYASLNPRQTIGSIIGEGLEIHHIGTREERRRKIIDLMESVGLHEGHFTRYPHEFSGGQRQRIGIARALALEPRLIVCDEPLSSLDVSIQAQVINLLLDIQDKYELTYLFISHDLNIVRHMCDRIAVMYVGKMVEIGSKEEIYNFPAHPYTKALLASVPKLEPGSFSRGKSLKGDVPNPAAPPKGCYFHPRCDHAMPICREEMPDLISLNGTHYVRCWLYS